MKNKCSDIFYISYFHLIIFILGKVIFFCIIISSLILSDCLNDCDAARDLQRQLRSRYLPSTNATTVHSREEPAASKPASVQGIVLSPNAYRITAGLTEQNRIDSASASHMLMVLTPWSKLNAGRIPDFAALFEFFTDSTTGRTADLEDRRVP